MLEYFNYFCSGVQPFSNTGSLVEFARKHNVRCQLAEEIHRDPFNANFVEYIIDQFEYVYVTVCLDVFHVSLAPGVSAPQILGVYPEYIIKSLRKLKKLKLPRVLWLSKLKFLQDLVIEDELHYHPFLL